MTKYIALLCLVASWMVPAHFLPWVSWQNELLSFLAALLLAWHGLFELARRKGSSAVFLPASALLFLALGVIAAIQGATGLITFAGDALVVEFYLALCVICVSLGFASGRKTEVVQAGSQKMASAQGDSAVMLLAFALLAGAFLSAVVAFAQAFEVWEGVSLIGRMPALRRPGGNLGQPNQLATLLLMGVVSLLYLYESRKLTAIPAALMLFVLVAGVAATESRTGVLSFFMLVIWFFAKRRSVGFQLRAWVVALSMLGFLCLFWVWPVLISSMQMEGAGAAVNIQLGTRLIVWPQLLDAVALRPWLGWGIGRVSDAHNAVAHLYAVSEAFTYSHNILLDLALGVGVPLAAVVVLVTVVWLWRRVRAANQLLPWYCLAAALPVAVHSMLEFPYAYAYLLAPVMFLFGVLDSAVGVRSSFRVGVLVAAVTLFITTALMAWSVIEYVAIEEDFRVVRFEALRIGNTPASYQRPHVVLLTQLDALLHGGRIVPKPGMTADELALAKKVALRFPWPATQNRYAQSLALNGNPDEAIRQLRVIRVLHGEAAYAQVKAGWTLLANEKYPQLQALKLP